MSLSDIPRNHFDPLNHFPPRDEHFSGYFPQPLSPPAFLSHGISQLSNAFYAHHPAIFNMNALSQEEMERYQELSNKYEPELPVRHLCALKKVDVSYPTDAAHRDRLFLTNNPPMQLRWIMQMLTQLSPRKQPYDLIAQQRRPKPTVTKSCCRHWLLHIRIRVS